MIAQLRGRLLRKQPGEIVIDVSGVGYEVFIPVTTFYRLGDPGSDVDLLIHTQVRDDAIALFGFQTGQEKQLFELLIQVAGVGPRLAVGILSGIEAPDLVLALQGGDLARLTRIPGVGKKTAERLVLELRDKLKGLRHGEATRAPGQGALAEDLVSALANLGYSRPEAEKGVERALRQGEAPFEEVLRRSLRILSGRP